MKIICTQENLLKTLSIVSTCIKKSTSLPILSNILLKAENQQISLSATDLEIGITSLMRGRVEQEGKTAIPAQIFFNYVNNLPLTKISLELENNILILSCGYFKAKIKCFDPSEFPLIPKINKQSLCKIKGSDLKKTLNQVVFAASRDESRPEIAGILLKFKNPNVLFVATDSYRLAEKIIKPLQISDTTSWEFIVPRQTMQELNRILPTETEKVEIFTSENQIKFSFNGVELISRLVEGRYPDYARIIPENHLTKIKLNTKDLIDALKSSSLFSKPDTNEVEIEIDTKKAEVKVLAESRQVGSSEVKIFGEAEGKDEKIIFNHQYFLDGLACISTNEIVLTLNGDAGPGIIKPVGNTNYSYIIMPIKK